MPTHTHKSYLKGQFYEKSSWADLMHKLTFSCLVVSEHLLLLGVVSLGLALLQIFGVILTSCLFARYIEGYYYGFPEKKLIHFLKVNIVISQETSTHHRKTETIRIRTTNPRKVPEEIFQPRIPRVGRKPRAEIKTVLGSVRRNIRSCRRTSATLRIPWQVTKNLYYPLTFVALMVPFSFPVEVRRLNDRIGKMEFLMTDFIGKLNDALPKVKEIVTMVAGNL